MDPIKDEKTRVMEELKGLVGEILTDKGLDNFESKYDEAMEALSKQKEEIDALKAAPTNGPKLIGLPVPGEPGKVQRFYKNFDLNDQGRELSRNMKNAGIPVGDLTLEDDQQRMAFAKMTIAMIKSAVTTGGAAGGAITRDLTDLHDMGCEVDNDGYLVQKKTLVDGTAATAGNLVFPEYERTIWSLARAESFALNDCDVVTMNSDVKYVPAESTTVEMAWRDEVAVKAESEPSTKLVTLTAKSLAAYLKASDEFMEDTEFDVVSWFMELFATGQGQELDEQVLVGTGTPISGIMINACVSTAGNEVVMPVGSTSFSNLSYDDLINVLCSIPPRLRRGAKWYASPEVFCAIRKLKDSDGNPLWGPMALAQPGTLHGYPYWESEVAPTASPAASTAFLVFGNMKHFAIGRRSGLKLKIDPYTDALNNIVRFIVHSRWAFAYKYCEAFATLKTGAAS